MSEIKIITKAEEIDREKWDEFVFNHPLGNIYQTPHLFQLFNETKNYEPIIIISKENEKINGVLQAVIIREGGGAARKFTSRSIITGGPLVQNDDNKIVEELFIEYQKIISKKVIFTEIREIFNLPFTETFEKLGYTAEKRLNILVDLTKTEEKLWSEVHSKRRNEIKRAEKYGVIVKEIENEDNVNKGYEILEEVYQRAKLPLADRSLFVNCLKYLVPINLTRFLGAYYEGDLIGVMFSICYKDRVIDWYAGSSKRYYDKNPNDLLPWKAFQISKKAGYKIFDFGGAGKPNVPYGVRDYKKKFGGDFIELNRYQKVHKPILMQTGKLGLKLWQKFK